MAGRPDAGCVWTNVVAWLRIMEGSGAEGDRLALLETSPEGEPLGFGFARARRAAVARVAGALLDAAGHTPALIVALEEEWAPHALPDAPHMSAPLCLVGADGENSGCSLRWTGEPSEPDCPAGRAFSMLKARREPFEPLERAATGLNVAFTDVRVQQAACIAGLDMLFSLLVKAPGRTDGSGTDLDERLRAVLAVPREPSVAGSDLRLEWTGELMPFQQDGVRALLEMDRLLLADDMGLGKTVQAVAALRLLAARGEVGPSLVIAPASLLDQWRRELAKWAPELSAIVVRGPADDRTWQWRADKDVVLSSYETLRADAGRLSALRPPGERWSSVVADEAQRIKNRNDTSRAVKRLPRMRSWALTGTPVENHEDELASIMEFVDHDGGERPVQYRPGPELLRRHRELQLRRRKGDVLADLPPKLESRLALMLRPEQRSSYDRAEQEGIVYLRSLGASVTVRHILELITRLKQICNFDPQTGVSAKMDDIGEKLREVSSRGHKALIFSQYANEISGVKAAAHRLKEFDPLVLTGEVPVEARPRLVERFRTSDRHRVMVVSLRAGGVGLNLQEASYVFHLDRWWNPAVERQAEDRAHRIGQRVKLNVIKYICADTIEERIDGILAGKQELFDRVVDDVSLDLSKQLTRRQLLALFGL